MQLTWWLQVEMHNFRPMLSMHGVMQFRVHPCISVHVSGLSHSVRVSGLSRSVRA